MPLFASKTPEMSSCVTVVPPDEKTAYNTKHATTRSKPITVEIISLCLNLPEITIMPNIINVATVHGSAGNRSAPSSIFTVKISEKPS